MLKSILSILVLCLVLTGCSEKLTKTVINPSEVIGVNIWTDVLFKHDYVTAPEMTVAKAEAIAVVAERLRTGEVTPAPETQYVQLAYKDEKLDGSFQWHLGIIRIPIKAMLSAPVTKDPRDYLNLADRIEISHDPDADMSDRYYCEDKKNLKASPHFCELIYRGGSE